MSNWTYFMKCSVASEKGDPARRNLMLIGELSKTCTGLSLTDNLQF